MAVRDFQELVERVPEHVWTTEPDGSVVYLNERWLEYTGMPMKRALGWGWRPIVHPTSIDPLELGWARALRTAQPWINPSLLRREADGEFRWVLAHGIPIRSAGGSVLGYLGTNVDIHELYGAFQDLAVEHVVRSEAYHATQQRLGAAYAELLAYVRDGVVARGPDGEPVSDAPALSLVELQVLRLCANGCGNRHIARRLNLTVAAIERTLRSTCDKLESRHRTSAAVRAARFGLI